MLIFAVFWAILEVSLLIGDKKAERLEGLLEELLMELEK
jgi:hypothetical protein